MHSSTDWYSPCKSEWVYHILAKGCLDNFKFNRQPKRIHNKKSKSHNNSYKINRFSNIHFFINRKVLDQAIAQALPPKKIKVLFKKYIAFEEKHGSPENVSRIQELAVKYVEEKCNKVD